MYLEKLQIQGFKSFAQKNELIFPGMIDQTKRGLTAVVGPNGSGKSNVADAVRWALGEQSMKSLRGKKSEDVIFSGSDKKGKLGMAEVSLHLNNEDKKAPIDYSELVITRRLYRSGESEYLINGSRVRLSDIQMLLAKAKFGQKTYSVIGQGMVEGFLNTSLSERKEFFDEATGVKQYQIKRDDALNKLRASYENLSQADMLLVEIEPRLKSLTRQVNKLHKRGELEEELKNKQTKYYRKIWHENHDSFLLHNKNYLELEKKKIDKEKKMQSLSGELAELESQNGVNEEFNRLQSDLTLKQSERDEITKKIARLEAELEVDLEAKGNYDLSFLNSRLSSLAKEQTVQNEKAKLLTEELTVLKNNLSRKENERKSIEDTLKRLNEQLAENASSSKSEQEMSKKLEKTFIKLQKAEEEDDLEKIKILIREVIEEIEVLISSKTAKPGELEKTQEEIKTLLKRNEDIFLQINSLKLDTATKKERLIMLDEANSKIDKEKAEISEKMNNAKKGESLGNVYEQLSLQKKSLKNLEEKADVIKNKIENISKKEEESRGRLFSLQRNIQNIQNELNSINSELNSIKINATRYETKLEDLEIEIRENLGTMKEVRQKKPEEFNEVEIVDSIRSLKKQLDLIGGIDLEVEKEYEETKERFDFLDSQVTDLTSAIESLEKIIKELDATIKEIFDKEFKIIQAKFSQYFKILFNGGKANIVKVMEKEKDEEEKKIGGDEAKNEDKESRTSTNLKKIKFLQKHNATGMAGIEIQATPPGKKIQAISMLSGGERALTAIALISAIISANPSPFVVLDEVDAALDEANSERLAKILDDLSHKTQFIVITHNRASMRRAAILYGVTMLDDGVSKLLSIKLEDAKSVVKN